ncbi:MAG: phosphopantothenoylcysteine synthase [Clostridiales bacterium]|jgi:phosphopantothenate-cysteine ligase|nr:phosphopantothenoylcysteine synthase [Clostridiales bacterium]
MNVLVTAGGTTEQIDSVRGISNMSTGTLGSCIADSFSDYPEVSCIRYICGESAVLPITDKAGIVQVHDVKSLEDAVRCALNAQDFDIIVHAMAVSDYRVKWVTSAAFFADYLKHRTKVMDFPEAIHASAVSLWLENAQTAAGDSGKISSDIDNLILLMERTPKIIALFKDLSPKSLLVGFKLLDHVAHDSLIEAANHIMRENSCAFVLANDLKDIDGDRHIGYLIDRAHNIKRYETKKEIAFAIAEAAITCRRTEQ